VECEDTGLCLLRSEVEEDGDGDASMSDEEFDSWFEEETGRANPFSFDLDPAVMREVASMHDDMAGSHGLDRYVRCALFDFLVAVFLFIIFVDPLLFCRYNQITKTLFWRWLNEYIHTYIHIGTEVCGIWRV